MILHWQSIVRVSIYHGERQMKRLDRRWFDVYGKPSPAWTSGLSLLLWGRSAFLVADPEGATPSPRSVSQKKTHKKSDNGLPEYALKCTIWTQKPYIQQCFEGVCPRTAWGNIGRLALQAVMHTVKSALPGPVKSWIGPWYNLAYYLAHWHVKRGYIQVNTRHWTNVCLRLGQSRVNSGPTLSQNCANVSRLLRSSLSAHSLFYFICTCTQNRLYFSKI